MATKNNNGIDHLVSRLQRDFLGGSIRLHILHHAGEGEVFGAGLMEELGRHGYKLSPGTLYPVLHALERGSYLRSRIQIVGGRRRRTYSATALGKAVVVESRSKVLELVHELFEHDAPFAASPRPRRGPDVK
jgi:DNA-binding PadR family transcriptional regulator